MTGYIYCRVTHEEHTLITARARKEGLSLSDYVRRALNTLALEEDEAAPLLEEIHRYGQPRA